MRQRANYRVRARRSGSWWAIDVADVPGAYSQSRRLDQVEALARDAIALIRDVDPQSFDVQVEPVLEPSLEHLLRNVRYHRSVADEAAELATAGSAEAARRLTEHHYTVRDIGSLLGLSFQRAAQLTGMPPHDRQIRETATTYEVPEPADLPSLVVGGRVKRRSAKGDGSSSEPGQKVNRSPEFEPR